MFSKYSVKKPYTVIVGIILVIVLGYISFQKMTTDLLPSMNLPYVVVYTTYIGAVNGITTHKTNIEKGNFRISLTKRGDYIYKLLNGNGQLLSLGEHYKTKRLCQSAVESVKRFAKNSPVLTDPNLTK